MKEKTALKYINNESNISHEEHKEVKPKDVNKAFFLIFFFFFFFFFFLFFFFFFAIYFKISILFYY